MLVASQLKSSKSHLFRYMTFPVAEKVGITLTTENIGIMTHKVVDRQCSRDSFVLESIQAKHWSLSKIFFSHPQPFSQIIPQSTGSNHFLLVMF